jgi:hypothetical protein
MPSAPSTNTRPADIATIVLVVVIATVFYVTLGSFAHQNAYIHDFLAFYTSGKMVSQGDAARLYDTKAQLEYQKILQPDNPELVPYIRPRYYAELFRPLSKHPRAEALLIWQALQALFLLAATLMVLLLFAPQYLIIAALSLVAPLGIANGQDAGFMAFLAALSLYLFLKNRPLASGAVLGLCLFKWHLLALVPVAMLLGRQYKLLGGFAVTSLLTLALDFALSGLSGWNAYAQLLTRTDLARLNPGVHLMPNLKGIFTNLGIPSLWPVGLAIVVPSFVLSALRLSWPHALLATQLAAVLIVPHTFNYDVSWMLLPAVNVLATGVQGRLKWAAFLLLMPVLPFLNLTWPPWTGFLGLLLLFFLASYGLAALRRDPALQ